MEGIRGLIVMLASLVRAFPPRFLDYDSWKNQGLGVCRVGMIYSTPDDQKYIDIRCMYFIIPAAADIDIPLDVQKDV